MELTSSSYNGTDSLRAATVTRSLPITNLDADYMRYKCHGLHIRKVAFLSKTHQREPRLCSEISVCALKSNRKGSAVFEKGIFENVINTHTDENEDNEDNMYNLESNDEDVDVHNCEEAAGLIPEDWKSLQVDLYKTKAERKFELRQKELENVKRKALELQQKRQKLENLSSTIQRTIDEEQKENKPIQTASKIKRNASDFDLFTDDEIQCLKGETDMTAIDCKKWRALHVLAASGQFFLLDEFLKFNADINVCDEDGYTAIQRAVLARKETAVNQLLRAGAQLNVLDKDGASLLHLSAQTGSLNLIRLFVKYGLDVNHPDENGWTPLHVAALTGREDIVRHLLITGAHKDLKTKDGYTALDICLALGKGFRSYGIAKALKLLPKVANEDNADVYDNNIQTI